MENENSKSINLRITSSQTDGMGDTETMDFFTEARYYSKEGSEYLTYKESEISGLQGTTSTLKVSPGEVTLMRFGSVNSKMVFRQGCETTSIYDTGFGSFEITVFAEKVDIGICNNKLNSIYLKYTLMINASGHFANEMRISIMGNS